jgi:hypothetical protein
MGRWQRSGKYIYNRGTSGKYIYNRGTSGKYIYNRGTSGTTSTGWGGKGTVKLRNQRMGCEVKLYSFLWSAGLPIGAAVHGPNGKGVGGAFATGADVEQHQSFFWWGRGGERIVHANPENRGC